MTHLPQMSLEAALDEERKEILDILEGRNHAQPSAPRPGRHASPAPPPVRSMLDIAPDPGSQRHGSIAGIGVGITQPPNRNVRSMLEPIAPSPLRLTQSATSSPTTDSAPTHDSATNHRRASDSSTKGLPELKKRQGVDPQQDYQFEMLPSVPSALPKRVTQGGRLGHHNNAMQSNSMAAVMSGGDMAPYPGYPRGGDTGRHPPIPEHSRSPSSHLRRSRSPRAKMLNNNSLNLLPTPGKFVTDSGKVIDLDRAYRRLSTAALSRSRGNLANYPSHGSTGSDGGTEGDSRLQKDYYSDTPEGGFSEDCTSDDGDSSSVEDAWESEINRGRRRIRKKLDFDGAEDVDDRSQRPHKVQSLLAAAEEERASISSSYKVKSLLDPVAPRTVKAAAERPMHKKTGVHPNTSFDITASAGNTPVGSEDEAEFSDIKKAQNLSIYMSPVDQSVPNRVIRTIIRGDFSKTQEDGDHGRRRLRKYLVASDLSEESTYALEWTIGTILRDGDTMYAVFAIEEESGSGKSADTDSISSVNISDGAKVVLDIATTVGSQTEKTLGDSNRASAYPSPHGSSVHMPDSKSGSIDSRAATKTESERLRAIEILSQTVVRLLRKTRLQVRVAIEIIHCKSPKHLITEAIDALEPTLVVLGSRGRSALKGVLLGSFSNYIVTKSSVPVMVARKKLRKHAKFKNTPVRLSNNLTTPKKLAFAKID